MNHRRTISGRFAPEGPPPQYGVPAQDRAAARARGDLGPPGVPVFFTPDTEADLLRLETRLLAATVPR